MQHLFLDCSHGMSGDMTLASLAHLGVDLSPLPGLLAQAGVACRLEVWREERGGGPGCRVEVSWEAEGQPLRLIALTLYHKNWLEDHYPGRFCFEQARDGFDYLYSVDRLADLPGKKLHAKRNHIHRLDEACPGWTWAPLTQADIPACLAMDAAWHQDALTRETVRGLSTLDDEHRALVLALEHLPALGLEGIVLRWQDTLLGFTLGAPLTETIFDVHFERARGEIQGAYPAVNRSFARYIRQKYPHIRYLDREDDMGLPGLRKAKLSYAPDYLQVNFSAVECRAP